MHVADLITEKELIMNNVSKFLGISLMICLLVLSTACWEDAMTLIMTVDTPQNGATVSAPSVTVSGTVNKSAKVKINEVEVRIKDGKFSSDVKLAEGRNVINVAGKSGQDTVEKTVTVTYTPNKP